MSIPPKDETSQTGDCYEASFVTAEGLLAIKQIVEAATTLSAPIDPKMRHAYEQFQLSHEIYIIHGWIRPDPSKESMTHHAWVKVGNLTVESQSGRTDTYSKEEYENTYGPIKYTAKYTVAEAKLMVDKHGGYGNWAAKESA